MPAAGAKTSAITGSAAQKAQDWAQASAGTTVQAVPATTGRGEGADAEEAAAGAGVQHGHSSSYHKHRCNQQTVRLNLAAIPAGAGAEEAAISGTAMLTAQEWAWKSVQQWTLLYQQAQPGEGTGPKAAAITGAAALTAQEWIQKSVQQRTRCPDTTVRAVPADTARRGHRYRCRRRCGHRHQCINRHMIGHMAAQKQQSRPGTAEGARRRRHQSSNGYNSTRSTRPQARALTVQQRAEAWAQASDRKSVV